MTTVEKLPSPSGLYVSSPECLVVRANSFMEGVRSGSNLIDLITPCCCCGDELLLG